MHLETENSNEFQKLSENMIKRNKYENVRKISQRKEKEKKGMI